MSVFMVTWNLNNEGSNYSPKRKTFIEHLERFPNIKDSGLESVRWIKSQATAEQVYGDLATKLDGNDRIFVTQMTAGTHSGWLDKNVCDWIYANL